MRKKHWGHLQLQEQRVAFWFIAPFFIGFLIFQFFPILYALFISLVDYDKIKPFIELRFVGLHNYIHIFHDSAVIHSYLRAIYYSLYFVPSRLIFSFILALLLNRNFYARKVIRTLIFMPYVANILAISLIMNVVFNPFHGPVNQLLQMLGDVHPPLWLNGIHTVLPTIAGISVWQSITFDTIVYLAALQGVPRDLYESVGIDGANWWQKIRYITFPFVSPASFFILVTSTISSLQNFTIIRVLTNGGPGTSSQVIALNIYNTAFSYSQYSYASAQALLLFLFILLITIIQWRGQKKWVHY